MKFIIVSVAWVLFDWIRLMLVRLAVVFFFERDLITLSMKWKVKELRFKDFAI